MEPVEESSNTNLGLKIMFAVLVLVLIAEIAFGVMNSKKKNPVRLTQSSSSSLSSTSPTPSAKKTNPTLRQEYQAKITELNVMNITPTPGAYNVEFSFKLEIRDGETKEYRTLYFDKNGLSNLKVIDTTGKIISYQDMKLDQNIKMILIYDQNQKKYTKFEIIVLN